MNLEELKRLDALRNESMDGVGLNRANEIIGAKLEFLKLLDASFPAIVAKLEAADRFSNDVESEVTSFLGYGDDGVVGDANVVRAVQIMRAKLEAAQRLRDDLMQIMAPTVSNMREAANQSHMVAMAIAAFDKEQQ